MNRLKWRRFKQKVHDHKIKYLIVALFVFVFMLSSGYALLQTTLSIGGRATIDNGNQCDISIVGDYQVNNSWNTNGLYYYDVTISIENRGEEDIENWKLVIDGPSDVDINWINATYTIDSGIIVATPLSYNNTIEAGDTFSLSFSVSTVEDELIFNAMSLDGCVFYGNGGSLDSTLTALDITPNSFSIAAGEVEILTPIRTPVFNKSQITWTSSNTSVATVSNDGTVTGVSVGQATITATCEGISATSTITVTESTVILESISITPSSYRMTVSEEVTLQVNRTPSNAAAAVVWSSSDPTVASVDQNGRVTGVSVGQATITATANGNITATCSIKVANAISSSDVNITHELIGGGYMGGDTVQFRIDIENLTDEDIPYIKITYDLPDDLTWSNWQSHNVSFNGNVHEMIVAQNNVIPANGTYSISGSVTYPEKYLEDGFNPWGGAVKVIPQQYLDFPIDSIEFE